MSPKDEALKTLGPARTESRAPDSPSLKAPERRQTRRWELDVPLTVYGRGLSGTPFYQAADAVNASVDGALIVIKSPVREGQELLLINNFTSKEQLCRVVRVRSRDAETNEIGVAFASPNPEFWKVPDSDSDLPEEPSDEGF